MPRGRSAKVRGDARPASSILEDYRANPEGDTEGEDNSHLPPLPLPTVDTPRRIDPETGRVKWSLSEFEPDEEGKPEEEPEEEGEPSEGPAPSLGPDTAVVLETKPTTQTRKE
jgi:hypothetical protein